MYLQYEFQLISTLQSNFLSYDRIPIENNKNLGLKTSFINKLNLILQSGCLQFL